MERSRATALIIISLVISGCATTQQVANRLGNQYIGKNFDEFVVKNGAPFNSYKLSSGDTVQQWSASRASMPMPGTSTTNYTGNQAHTIHQPGGNMDLVCDIQFRISPDNIVKEINILQDSFGVWSNSRCDEVLRK